MLMTMLLNLKESDPNEHLDSVHRVDAKGRSILRHSLG